MAEARTEVDLVAAVQRGDELATRELIRRHGDYLFAVARTLTDGPADADDAVQDTLAAVLTAGFRGESSLRTFLVAILVRRAARARRKKRPRLRLAAGPERPADEGTAGDKTVGAVDAKIDLAALLGRLSPEHREVLVLRELQGLTYEEMAAVLGLPRGTVESRLHRAREQLRKLWEW